MYPVAWRGPERGKSDEDEDGGGTQNDNEGDEDGNAEMICYYTGWFFLNVPPNFRYHNEKRWAANQRFCSMKFSMYKRSSLVEQRFSF